MTRQQILKEAMQLAPQEREALIDDLLQLDEDGDLSADQIAELERRVAAVERGDVTMIPGEQVLAELRKRFEP